MRLNEELVAEIRLLTVFSLSNHQEGLKVHHDAESELVAAASRLYAKGLISQADGGYLTGLGIEAAEHAQHLLTILTGV
jgi:uncharacterized protein (TIGR02647 family)